MAQKHSRQLLQLNMVVPNAVLDSWERKIKSWDAVGIKKKHAKIVRIEIQCRVSITVLQLSDSLTVNLLQHTHLQGSD